MVRILPLFFSINCLCVLDAFAVDFAREVLPVLSDKCFACHGPDNKKKNLVRLDLEELAKKDLGGYHGIDPEDFPKSELILRTENEDDPMPPKDFGKVLTKEEKSLIKEWVFSGGEYAQHCAFVFPRKNSQPEDNPIDIL